MSILNKLILRFSFIIFEHINNILISNKNKILVKFTIKT